MGTATAANVLTGKTFTNASGVGIDGTMANKGAWTDTPTAKGKVTIPAGYHNGSGYVDTTSVYNKGVTDADARANTSSTNYKTGYDAGVAAGKPTKTQTVSQTYTWSLGTRQTITYTFSNLSTVVGITNITYDNIDYSTYQMKISGNTVIFDLFCREHANTTINISITAIGY